MSTTSVEEIKSLVIELLDDGPLRNGALMRKIIKHNGGYGPADIIDALHDLCVTNVISCFDDGGVLYYGLNHDT